MKTLGSRLWTDDSSANFVSFVVSQPCASAEAVHRVCWVRRVPWVLWVNDVELVVRG